MNQRPTGITILAVLAFIGGVLAILGGLSLVFLGSAVGTVTNEGGIGTLGILFGAIGVVEGGVYILVAFGFWKAIPWGWPLGIAMALISIGVAIAQVVLGYASIFSAGISIVIGVIILYYLNQPNVKRYFGR